MSETRNTKKRVRSLSNASAEQALVDGCASDPKGDTSKNTDSPQSQRRGKKKCQKNRQRRPRHPKSKRKTQGSNKDTAHLPEESTFVALDCEMVGIGESGHKSSLARVTIIDWYGETLLDEYIQQTEPITDYRTFVSGIEPQDLEQATLTLAECREMVLQLLQDHILVGHALKNDLKALGITHPWWLIRDTAKYEPFMKVRFDDGILWPRKLKDLVSEKLKQEIQLEGQPHSPYEDAQAALDLYRSVRSKWERVMTYKVAKTNKIRLQQEQQILQPILAQ